MDPTMQSPIRRTLPLSGGTQITLPSGPHFYETKHWVGSLSQGNTPQQAFKVLLGHATPFQGGVPTVDGGILDVDGFGPVRQRVDPDHLTVVNTTEPDHLLHPGNVFRSIIQEGDDLYIVTRGYGTGVFPALNRYGARIIWSKPDHEVRRALNPYGLLGYPMDEMNAVTGQPVTSERKLNGLITNEPMPDWSVPPPIFDTH